jgi:hypothetical protein
MSMGGCRGPILQWYQCHDSGSITGVIREVAPLISPLSSKDV